MRANILSPFTYKSPDGKWARLPRNERIRAVALFIFTFVIPAIFYYYTLKLKKEHFRLLSAHQTSDNPHTRRQHLGTWIPALASICDKVDPLHEKVKALLIPCKNGVDQAAKRQALLELAPLQRDLEGKVQEMSEQMKAFLKSSRDPNALKQVAQALVELKPVEDFVKSVPAELEAAVEALPLSNNPQEEPMLIGLLPAVKQGPRFDALLKTLKISDTPESRRQKIGIWIPVLAPICNAVGSLSENAQALLKDAAAKPLALLKLPSLFLDLESKVQAMSHQMKSFMKDSKEPLIIKQVALTLEELKPLEAFVQAVPAKLHAAVEALPPSKDLLEEVKLLSDKVKTLLNQCKSESDEAKKRQELLQIGAQLRELKIQAKDMSDQMARFLERAHDPKLYLAPLFIQRVNTTFEELNPLQDFVKGVPAQLQALVEALPLTNNMQEEIALINYLPSHMQRSRFEALLATQYVRYQIHGDGACGARSLTNGVWPEILELRKTDPIEAKQKEDEYSLKLRREVADYMLAHRADFEPFCDRLPGPDGAGGSEEIRFEDYIKGIREPHAWFGQQELRAAAEVYKKRIHTFFLGSVQVVNNKLQPRDELIYGAEFTNAPIPIYHMGGHYEVMTEKP